MTKRILTTLVIISLTVIPALADYKVTQKRTIENMGIELTIYSKGVRERREQKIQIGSDPQMAAMMEQMMPNLTQITQCDLKQDIQLNPKYKSFFVDYYDWSTVPAEKRARRPQQKVTVKGTATISSTVVDSGKRRMMFGLNARWLKHTLDIERSADSCDGAGKVRIEKEGWFVTLSLNSEVCQTPRGYAPDDGGCRPRPIIKSMQDPGFFLEGTTTSYENGKMGMVEKLETLDLSKATLDQTLFEAPIGFTEVDSMSELMRPISGPAKTTAITSITGVEPGGTRPKNLKTIAIDFFSGNAQKIDQNELRTYISGKVNAAGMSGFPINSQSELAGGTFEYVIGVEIKKVKESGASKIGGLFGKVTGSDSASQLGNSQAEIVVNIFGKDGKTVIASSPANVDVKGKANDAVRAAIDQVINSLLAKIK